MPDNLIANIIFLPLILSIGAVTSYEDFKKSKIRNRWILFGLISTFVSYLSFWILYGLFTKGIIGNEVDEYISFFIHNFDRWCINLLISFIVGYLLWRFKMWSAGDAKLFMCYAAIIPLGQYSNVYFNYYFASFFLLLAIFIPATIYVLLRATLFIIKTLFHYAVKKEVPLLIKKNLSKFNGIESCEVLLGFFVLFLFFRIVRTEAQNFLVKFIPNQDLLMLISFLGFRQLSKIFKKNFKLMIFGFFMLVCYFGLKMTSHEYQFIHDIANSFIRVILMMILLPLFTKIVDFYAERSVKKTTPFAHWMFLGALITWFL